MKTFTEDQVKELINGLVDLKEQNNNGFTENEMFWRRHGIELAINKLKYQFLNEWGSNENDKYDLSPSLLKTA